jgi:2-polyprenyl-6-hydroxyphenyl methylase/3-demethylubiquinone-9 3-methyltransferase
MTTARQFYESYWQDKDAAPPADDPLRPQQWAALELELARLPRDARILDAGCGAGFFAERLAQTRAKVLGVDVARNALSRGRASYAAGSLEGGLPLADASVDLAFSIEVIEHLLDPRRFVQELARVVVDDGRLLLSTPYHGLAKNLVIATVGFDRHFDVTGPHVRFFSRRSLTTMLDKAGFSVDRVSYMGRVRPLAKSVCVHARRRPRSHGGNGA